LPESSEEGDRNRSGGGFYLRSRKTRIWAMMIFATIEAGETAAYQMLG